MSRFDPSDISSVVTVTVTYNPVIAPLRAQFEALPRESLKLVVDNASQPKVLREIESLVAMTPGARLLRNDKNLGLAAAFNRGVREARAVDLAARFVLLLDQDSEPASDSVETLLAGFESLQANGVNVGCVGPTLLDVATGLTHGFHRCTRWRWHRIHPPLDAIAPVECASLNGSGTLVPIDLFLELGGLEEALFIDHVDTEWAFRVQTHGYRLFGIPKAVFQHRMGDTSRRMWIFGWRVWPVRSPQRHYFLYRNAIILMRRKYVPQVWKVWAMLKLGMTTCVLLMTGPRRYEQLRCITIGFRDAVRKSREGLL